jgi:hypothetical protein
VDRALEIDILEYGRERKRVNLFAAASSGRRGLSLLLHLLNFREDLFSAVG